MKNIIQLHTTDEFVVEKMRQSDYILSLRKVFIPNASCEFLVGDRVCYVLKGIVTKKKQSDARVVMIADILSIDLNALSYSIMLGIIESSTSFGVDYRSLPKKPKNIDKEFFDTQTKYQNFFWCKKTDIFLYNNEQPSF